MRCAISMRMMRVAYPSGSEELRSALGQDWVRLIASFPSVTLVPVLNMGSSVSVFLDELDVSAVILSGGEDIGLFPARDETEYAMVEYALARRLPVLGVCRGAQLLNRHFGGIDAPVFGHVATRHEARFIPGILPGLDEMPREVNSYHRRAINVLGDNLLPVAVSPDASTEAFRHEFLPVWGVMWHPEREETPGAHDRIILSELFKDRL